MVCGASSVRWIERRARRNGRSRYAGSHVRKKRNRRQGTADGEFVGDSYGSGRRGAVVMAVSSNFILVGGSRIGIGVLAIGGRFEVDAPLWSRGSQRRRTLRAKLWLPRPLAALCKDYGAPAATFWAMGRTTWRSCGSASFSTTTSLASYGRVRDD